MPHSFNAVRVAHEAIAHVLNPSMVALDATAGNGYDTVFLAKRCRRVYAFDIQASALKKVHARLKKEALNNVVLIHDNHARVDKHLVEPFHVAMFNLGYLPNSDKSVKTKPHSTVRALKIVCDNVLEGGVITVVCYRGHEGGYEETEAVQTFIKTLDSNVFLIREYGACTHKNTPLTIVIHKTLNGGLYDGS